MVCRIYDIVWLTANYPNKLSIVLFIVRFYEVSFESFPKGVPLLMQQRAQLTLEQLVQSESAGGGHGSGMG